MRTIYPNGAGPLTQVFHYSSLINIITFSHTQQPQQFKAWINTPRNRVLLEPERQYLQVIVKKFISISLSTRHEFLCIKNSNLRIVPLCSQAYYQFLEFFYNIPEVSIFELLQIHLLFKINVCISANLHNLNVLIRKS